MIFVVVVVAATVSAVVKRCVFQYLIKKYLLTYLLTRHLKVTAISAYSVGRMGLISRWYRQKTQIICRILQ